MIDARNVLVTGASGFLGSALSKSLSTSTHFNVSAACRNEPAVVAKNSFVVGAIDENTDWSDALRGQTVVVHTAARAHVMEEDSSDPLSEYRKVNVDGTLNLARQSVEFGVKRFIFISSIKVNGEATAKGKPFKSSDIPNPQDAYGISKWEAERALWELAKESEIEIVVVRPPLIYGPQVKGNFSSLLKLVRLGVPLPLGRVQNLRSLVGIGNLIALITTCVDHPKAANQTFLVSDNRDLSTSELLERLGQAASKSVWLIPVPIKFLRIVAACMGKRAIAERLLGSLQVDISMTMDCLDWMPPDSVEEGFKRCVGTLED